MLSDWVRAWHGRRDPQGLNLKRAVCDVRRALYLSACNSGGIDGMGIARKLLQLCSHFSPQELAKDADEACGRLLKAKQQEAHVTSIRQCVMSGVIPQTCELWPRKAAMAKEELKQAVLWSEGLRRLGNSLPLRQHAPTASHAAC